jgi:hypothetical protein
MNPWVGLVQWFQRYPARRTSTSQPATAGVGGTSIHITALDGVMNVNSLFTLAAILGLVWQSASRSSDEPGFADGALTAQATPAPWGTAPSPTSSPNTCWPSPASSSPALLHCIKQLVHTYPPVQHRPVLLCGRGCCRPDGADQPRWARPHTASSAASTEATMDTLRLPAAEKDATVGQEPAKADATYVWRMFRPLGIQSCRSTTTMCWCRTALPAAVPQRRVAGHGRGAGEAQLI